MTSVSEKAKDLVKTSNGGSNGTGPQPKSNPVPPTMKGLKSVQVKDIFEKYKAQIAQAIPKHLTVDRVIQLATTLISRNPELAECSTESLLGAVLQTSILGFEPVQALGQCHLVPFNNKKTGKREVQFIIGYRGMVELTRRSNQLKTIYSQCVYSKDEFAYEFGLEPKLVHKPAMGDRGEFIYAYTVAHFNNGGYAFEVMSKYDVDKIRKRSQAGNSQYSPWNNDYVCRVTSNPSCSRKDPDFFEVFIIVIYFLSSCLPCPPNSLWHGACRSQGACPVRATARRCSGSFC